jgi:hypothetical protein
MKQRKAAVGFYRDHGKTKPITRYVDELNRKKIIKNPRFFRAVMPRDAHCTGGVIEPRMTEVEKVKGDSVIAWYPTTDSPPIFARSQEKVLCFARSPGGAIIGSVTGENGFAGGPRCIIGTDQKPDVDISKELVGDFGVIEEVRYHKPVQTVHVGNFTVNKDLLTRIEKAYENPRYELIDYKKDKNGKPIYNKPVSEKTDDVYLNEDKIKAIRNEINRHFKFRRNSK